MMENSNSHLLLPEKKDSIRVCGYRYTSIRGSMCLCFFWLLDFSCGFCIGFLFFPICLLVFGTNHSARKVFGEMPEKNQKNDLGQNCVNEHGEGKGVMGSEKDDVLVVGAEIGDQQLIDRNNVTALDDEAGAEEEKKTRGIVLSSDNRRRLQWTKELHALFVQVVKELGGKFKATPKHVLKAMNINGLTLHHVKSHLQKYRMGKYGGKESDPLQQEPNKGTSSSVFWGASSSGPPDLPSKTTEHTNIHLVSATRSQKDIRGELYLKLEAERHLQRLQEAERRYLDSALGNAYNTLMFDQRMEGAGTTMSTSGLGQNMFYANPAANAINQVDGSVNVQAYLGKQHETTQLYQQAHNFAPPRASYVNPANLAPDGFVYHSADPFEMSGFANQRATHPAAAGFSLTPFEGFSTFGGSAFQLPEPDAANLQFAITQPQRSNGGSMASYQHSTNMAPQGFGTACQLADTVDFQFGNANQPYITQPQRDTEFASGCSLASSYGGLTNLGPDCFSNLAGSRYQIDDPVQVQQHFGMAQEPDRIQPHIATYPSISCSVTTNALPVSFEPQDSLCFNEDTAETYLAWDEIGIENQANDIGSLYSHGFNL